MPPIKEIEKYENKWIAIVEPGGLVVGSGEDATDAKREAEEKGYKEVFLFKVLPFHVGYVPVA